MDWLELAIRYLGIATLTVIIVAGVGLLVLTSVMLVIRYTPRLHVGRPQNDGELCFYDRRVITTGKGDERTEGERRPIAEPLKIKWWFGLSRRNSSKWFVGFIRWDALI